LLVGSRLAYGFLHWGIYANNLIKLLQINAGGLDWMGLALGGLIAILIFAGFSSLNPAEILAINFHLIAILTIGIWMGAQVAGIGYGQIVEPSWWAFPVIDSSGDIHPRIPVPAVGALFSLLSYTIIDQCFQRSSLPAIKTLVFAAIQFALIYLATFFRDDPMVFIGSQPLDRLAALIQMALSLIAIASWTGYAYWQSQKLKNPTAV
jgi:prolipoprotein diacylglyceryltransferase